MNLQIDFWQLAGMVGAVLAVVFSGVIGLARWLAGEYDARQEMRFTDFRAASQASSQAQSDALHQHMQTSAPDSERLSDHAERLSDHAERISKMEAEMVGHPTHRDLAALYESINKLAMTVNQLVGESRTQSDLMRMLINREVSK